MKELQLPDPSYSSMCGNAMSQVCLEDCVFRGDGKHFVLARGTTVYNLPNQDINHLKPKLQFEIVKGKQTVIINHFQGEGDIYVRP